MKLIPKTEGDETWGWNTDDLAGLYIFKSEHALANDHQPEPPTTFDGVRIGHSGFSVSKVQIEIANLHFIGAGLFGESRGKEGSKWTGTAFRFGIYIYRGRFGYGKAVIIEQNGAGLFPYVVDELESDKTWTKLCEVLSPEMLWNVCMSFTHTYERGVRDGQRKTEQLFLAGRLKKQKKKGVQFLKVVPVVTDLSGKEVDRAN